MFLLMLEFPLQHLSVRTRSDQCHKIFSLQFSRCQLTEHSDEETHVLTLLTDRLSLIRSHILKYIMLPLGLFAIVVSLFNFDHNTSFSQIFCNLFQIRLFFFFVGDNVGCEQLQTITGQCHRQPCNNNKKNFFVWCMCACACAPVGKTCLKILDSVVKVTYVKNSLFVTMT